MTNSIEEIDSMGAGDLLFAIGTNTTECHPMIGVRILQAVKRGAKLIVADPRATTLTQHAHVWLRLQPGTDLALLNGLCQYIIENGLEDKGYIQRHCEGYSDYKEAMRAFDPSTVAKITKVAAQDIIQAASLMGNAENMATYYTMGITQHTSGVDNVTAVSNLAILTGNLGRVKTGVNPLRGQNNVQGSCDMGALPNVFPGYQKIESRDVLDKFEKAWNQPLSKDVGLTIPEVFEAIEKKEVKALYIFGENPLRSDPDINHVKHCLEAVDFLVVQDIFLTETAQLADIVLPGASFAEKDGTFSSTERRVQRVRKAIEPIGDSRPDWKILSDLLTRFGVAPDYKHPSDVFDEMAELTPTYSGINYNRLETGSLQWPCFHQNHPGTKILHIDKPLSGKAQFTPSTFRNPAEMPDENYPLMLTTGRIVTHYHTGTMTRKCWGLERADSYERAEIHPDDAREYGIKEDDQIRVSSRRGTLVCRAQVTERVTPGLVFMSFHFSESCSNILTNSASDPVTGTPELKVCSIKIEKIFPMKNRVSARMPGSEELMV